MTKFNYLIFALLFWGCSGKAQDKDTILVVDYSTYGFSYETGGLLEIENSIKIAQYKDYLGYRLTTFKKSGKSESTDIDITDKSGVKTYRYFVIKKGSQNGLLFVEKQLPQVLEYKKFLGSEGLNFADLSFFQLNLGVPDKIERNKLTNDIEIEKFGNKIKGDEEPDSLYRYYDKSLNSVSFSFNPAFDEKAKSKLWKIGLMYKIPKKITKSETIQRKESYWKIEKSNSKDDDNFLKIFNQFIAEREKMKLN